MDKDRPNINVQNWLIEDTNWEYRSLASLSTEKMTVLGRNCIKARNDMITHVLNWFHNSMYIVNIVHTTPNKLWMCSSTEIEQELKSAECSLNIENYPKAKCKCEWEIFFLSSVIYWLNKQRDFLLFSFSNRSKKKKYHTAVDSSKVFVKVVATRFKLFNILVDLLIFIVLYFFKLRECFVHYSD